MPQRPSEELLDVIQAAFHRNRRHKVSKILKRGLTFNMVGWVIDERKYEIIKMYRDGRGRIFNSLKCCLHGSLNDEFVINVNDLSIFFCIRKTLVKKARDCPEPCAFPPCFSLSTQKITTLSTAFGFCSFCGALTDFRRTANHGSYHGYLRP